MLAFLQQHQDVVTGTLRGWDRLLIKGTLTCIAHAKGFACFLQRCGKGLAGFGQYCQEAAEQIERTAQELTLAAHRPWVYVPDARTSKEQLARQILARDPVKEGLICTLRSVEPCNSYRLIQRKGGELLNLTRDYRKCLHFYHYLIHPVFGFMHLRVQPWAPFTLWLCLNGRHWLARQMDQAGIGYLQRDNCFVWVKDPQAAQALLQQQVQFHWEEELLRLQQQWMPAISQLLLPYTAEYYWSIQESEWATDLLFGSEAQLTPLYQGLLRRGIEQFSCPSVLRFLAQPGATRDQRHWRDQRKMSGPAAAAGGHSPQALSGQQLDQDVQQTGFGAAGGDHAEQSAGAQGPASTGAERPLAGDAQGRQ